MDRSITGHFAAGILLAIAVATAATADEIGAVQRIPEVGAAVRACMADAARLCADGVPGQGRIARCLARKPEQLSVACAAAMQKASDALIAAGASVRPGLTSQ